MIYDQSGTTRPDSSISLPRQHVLLRRHPVLVPVVLLSGSLVFGLAGFCSADLFPLLALLGIPPQPLSFSVAYALGISGILAGIISIIERWERCLIQVAVVAGSKE